MLFDNGAAYALDDIAEQSTRISPPVGEHIFLTTRPALGPTWVVDLGGTSTAQKLFMRTVQGAVNRRAARLYLINSDNPDFAEGEKFWLDEYQRRGWVEVAGGLSFDQAVAKFQPEIEGFVVATEAEPWSIHAAAVTAMIENGAVAPDAVADDLRGAGWRELGDMRGKWPDPVTAFQATVDAHRDELAYPGLALLRPTENLWDFAMQQEIMPVFSRPKHATWEGVATIMDSYPAGQILYGYVSDDTVEEEIAVERASSSGKYLVPTHEVSNLSFHVAVRGAAPLFPLEHRPAGETGPCDGSQVNVAVAITDGDNLQVPILQYPQSTFWNTPERGELPLGWSMGVSLATLAPGMWEFYRSTAGPNDEIVSLMGIAYVHASTLPEPEAYYRDTFAAMAGMGIHTLWSLDSSLTITDEPLWQILENAPGREGVHGVVVGYGPSIDKAFRRDTGTPVLITQNGYSEDAVRIRERIEAIMALDPARRSPVNFLMATNWNTSARALIDTLKPLAERGVRFLTPAQALACMPDIQGIARSAIDAQASPGSCLPAGRLRQFGSPILSAPTLAQINHPITLPVTLTFEKADSTAPEGTSVYDAALVIDLDGFARDFLQGRILPVVEGYGLSEEFAEHAWTRLVASDVRVRLLLPEGTGRASVSRPVAMGVGASPEITGKSLTIDLDGFTADSRSRTTAARVAFRLVVERNPGASPVMPETGRESIHLEFSLTVGIGAEEGPLVGGVSGSMACRGSAGSAGVPTLLTGDARPPDS